MGYDDDRYRDEEGEPIMDPDMQSDREVSPEPGDEDEDWGQERAASPAFDSGEEDAPKAKPRKRLIKKNAHESSDEAEQSHKRKSKDGGSGETRKKRKSKDDGEGREKKSKSKSGIANKLKKISRSGGKGESSRSNRGDTEMKEMWDTIAGADSEDDQEGQRTKDDEAFIDDAGVDPHDRFASDDEAGSIGDAPQAEEGEEDDDINKLFKSGKKKKKGVDRTPEETAMLVEQFMAKLEVAAEEDAELNRQSKPAINKLKMLPVLTEVLSKRQLQQEFLDRGVLSVLKNWLEPLPDGCLPNTNVRTALLKILTDLPIDVEQYDRKEQLKKSGLGKVIMFLSKSDEEIQSNRKLARDLVDKWSRPIFQKSTRYEDMRNFDEERVPYRRPPKKPAAQAVGLESRDDDLDLELSQESKSGQPGHRQLTTRPEAIAMDFVVRPQSKIDPEEIRARAKQLKQDERRAKMNKKLQQLKAPKKKKLQATKISVEGRGMVKYF
uniref:TFIIS N-terminal domain-containing protein n=1 Tax=Araucaria cunninghamii TaxID=56994 RepID=A0A0D6R9G8_ARACU